MGWGLVVVLWVWMGFVASCGYDSALGDAECANDGDCGDEASCEDGYCIANGDAGECDRDGDCDEGDICKEGECVEDDGECDSDDDCDDEAVCESGECVQECQEDSDCGDDHACEDGVCEVDCGDDEKWCDDGCVDVTGDPYCGACDLTCSPEETCVDGQCQDCPQGTIPCGDECVDPMVDSSHCGECSNDCGDGDCQAGVCVEECGEGQEGDGFALCGEEPLCVDTNVEVDHCGECDRACNPVPGASVECSGGRCVYQCDDEDEGAGYCPADEETSLDEDTGQGQCVDLDDDTDHCGGCFHQCEDPGESVEDAFVDCEDGSCVFGCDGDTTELCGIEVGEGDETDGDDLDFQEAECIDTDVEVDHCGGCEQACSEDPLGDVYCDGGECAVDCDDDDFIEECEAGSCTDTYTDNDHCGECDKPCESDQICQQGSCEDLPECSDENGSFGGGQGNAGNPYVICEEDHLRDIEIEDELDAHFILVDDLDFSDEDPLAPIGRGYGDWGAGGWEWFDIFEGSFDGMGFTIKGVELDASGDNRVGLFGFVGPGASVRNLNIVDVVVEGDDAVGAVAGRSEGQIESVVVEGGDIEGDAEVGGVVGRNEGMLEESIVNDTEVKASQEYAGGAVGYNISTGTVREVEADADVEGADRVGGLVGRTNADVEFSSASGSVSGQNRVGGLVGFVARQGGYGGYEGSVTGSDSSAVEVEGDDDVGGLVGRNAGLVEQSSVYDADVEASQNHIGGAVGYNSSTGTVREVEADADVEGANRVGGLVGRTNADVEFSSASGSVSGQNRVGGLVGYVAWDDGYWGYEGSVTGSNSSASVTGVNQVGGLVGRAWRQTTVENSGAIGDVDGERHVGGLVGLGAGMIDGSSAQGTVEGSEEFVGGLVGTVWAEEDYGEYDQGAVSQSFATGSVEASDASQVGGLVGRIEGIVANSYATGEVSGDEYVGGLVGYMWREDPVWSSPTVSSVFYSYAYGYAQGEEDVGGLIGRQRPVGTDSPDVIRSYWNVDAGVAESDGGESLTENEFEDQNSFQDWDFNDVWELVSERPRLRWED